MDFLIMSNLLEWIDAISALAYKAINKDLDCSF
jgi:hypothetical protein